MMENVISKWWFWIVCLVALITIVFGVCWVVTVEKGEYIIRLEMNEYMKDAMVASAQISSQNYNRSCACEVKNDEVYD